MTKLSGRRINKCRYSRCTRTLIEILQDELLTSGISLTVLEEKAAELEKENKSLLERWMSRIKAEAEKMNDANEFLEQIRGMKLSSPTAAESPEKQESL
jgi:hypothetical protein